MDGAGILARQKLPHGQRASMQKIPFDAEALKTWFRAEARDLPWRRAPTPYAVWVSEIMLQQTQVSVVEGYFFRWMQRFPTLQHLAAASLEEVIKVWEGLGYYSRARNLHAAARAVVEKYQGILPSTKEELSLLQGLGPYTMGAILSFAFHKKAAAVDGNVIRVLTRYFGISEDVQKSSTLKKIWTLAEEILPESEPWLVVEGLIELGATVCKKEPSCWACPLRGGCFAFRQGTQAQLPKKGKKVAITPLVRDVFIIAHGKRLLLKKGEEGKLMADLYEFPYTDRKEKVPFPFPFIAKKVGNLEEVQQSFTRFKVKLHPTFWKVETAEDVPGHLWVPFEEARRYPFSAGHKKILDHLRWDDASVAH
jgi:A/G-specific adenine glycosylase